jgi:hypothetical protein
MLEAMRLCRSITFLSLLFTLAQPLSGCFLLNQVREIAEADANFRNDGMRVNLRTVALALSMYARDHRGLYPPETTWLYELSRNYYLPNQRLPPNPWSLMGENTQVNILPRGDLPGIDGADFLPPFPGTVLGKGVAPHSGVYKPHTYGALLYAASPDRKLCVVYGIGQQGDNAVLVDVVVRGQSD